MLMKYLCLLFSLLTFLPLTAERVTTFGSPHARLFLDFKNTDGDVQLLVRKGKVTLSEVHLGLVLADETFDFSSAKHLQIKSQRSSGPYKEYLMTC